MGGGALSVIEYGDVRPILVGREFLIFDFSGL